MENAGQITIATNLSNQSCVFCIINTCPIEKLATIPKIIVLPRAMATRRFREDVGPAGVFVIQAELMSVSFECLTNFFRFGSCLCSLCD